MDRLFLYGVDENLEILIITNAGHAPAHTPVLKTPEYIHKQQHSPIHLNHPDCSTASHHAHM